MSQPPNLEARVTALEQQVAQLNDRILHTEQDAAAARVLAGGADRDVSELRSEIREFRDQNNRVLNAMRDDLNATRDDLNATRDDLADLRARMDRGFDQVDKGFIEIRGRLDATAAGLDQIAELLHQLIASPDQPPPTKQLGGDDTNPRHYS